MGGQCEVAVVLFTVGLEVDPSPLFSPLKL